MFDQQDRNITLALGFDDVMLVPSRADFMPQDVTLRSRLTRNIHLNMPVASAPMGSVTDSRMAIQMARLGGIGIIHREMTIGEQATQIREVKRYFSDVIENPLVTFPEASVADVHDLMKTYNVKALPVIDPATEKVHAMVTLDKVRFVKTPETPLSDLMDADLLIRVPKGTSREQARDLMAEHQVSYLVVTDDHERCVGMITLENLDKADSAPFATKDKHGRLRVGAAVGISEDEQERAATMIEAGADIILVDAPHAGMAHVIDAVRKIRRITSNDDFDVIVGNIATADAARALIDAGADALKVGIGVGSVNTTAATLGVGVPPISALIAVASEAKVFDVPVIADGGMRQPGDIVKALAAGAESVMLGAMLAGTDEAPGEIKAHDGRYYKVLHGKGANGAIVRGQPESYFAGTHDDKQHYFPEAVDARVPYKGKLKKLLQQVGGAMRAAMTYTGCQTVQRLHGAQFVRVTGATRSHLSTSDGIEEMMHTPHFMSDK